MNKEKEPGKAYAIEHDPSVDPYDEKILVCPIAKRIIDFTECMELYDACSYMIKPDRFGDIIDLETFDKEKRAVCMKCHFLYYD